MWKVTDALVSHKLEHPTVSHAVGVFVGQLEQHGVCDVKAACEKGETKLSLLKAPRTVLKLSEVKQHQEEWARLQEEGSIPSHHYSKCSELQRRQRHKYSVGITLRTLNAQGARHFRCLYLKADKPH